MRAKTGWFTALAMTLAAAAAAGPERQAKMNNHAAVGHEIAVLGAGCFWCVEAVFQRLDGVIAVTPGYAGGHTPDPSYQQVCTGETGHAEVARIEFDPARVSYAAILDLFWRSHDPTTLDRQGADVGTQYRSAILYAGEEQKRTAEMSKAAAQAAFRDPIVTEIVPLTSFYPAEDYHRQYFETHRDAPYCQYIIAPKLKKLGLAEKTPVTRDK